MWLVFVFLFLFQFCFFMANLPAKFHLGPISARYGYPSYLSCPKNCHIYLIVVIVVVISIVFLVVVFLLAWLIVTEHREERTIAVQTRRIRNICRGKTARIAYTPRALAALFFILLKALKTCRDTHHLSINYREKTFTKLVENSLKNSKICKRNLILFFFGNNFESVFQMENTYLTWALCGRWTRAASWA